MTTSARDAQAELAVNTYCLRGLVAVILRGPGPTAEPEDHGSGTLWRLEGRRAVVLTANHVVENHSSFTVMNAHGQVRLRNASSIRLPKHDIAILPLPSNDLDHCAFEPEALSDATEVAKREPVRVYGYPDRLSFTREDHIGEIKMMGTHTYCGFAAGSSRDLFSIEWKEGESTEEQARPFQHLGIESGIQPLEKPEGISGGAVWTQRKQGPVVWTVSGAVRFVGVPHKHSNQRQLAVPVWCWRGWLLERLQEQPR